MLPCLSQTEAIAEIIGKRAILSLTIALGFKKMLF